MKKDVSIGMNILPTVQTCEDVLAEVQSDDVTIYVTNYKITVGTDISLMDLQRFVQGTADITEGGFHRLH